MKTCSKCGREKSLANFYLRGGVPRGPCKTCTNEAQRKGYSDNKEKMRREAKERYWKNPQEKRREQRRRKYGISDAEWTLLFEKQAGACAVCSRANEKLCVDHNHLTGEIRALLCRRCNLALGFLMDSASLVSSLLVYIKKHS